MGRLTVNGLDGIIDDFSELAKLPDSVITDILNVESEICFPHSGQKIKAIKTPFFFCWQTLLSVLLQ